MMVGTCVLEGQQWVELLAKKLVMDTVQSLQWAQSQHLLVGRVGDGCGKAGSGASSTRGWQRSWLAMCVLEGGVSDGKHG